MPDHLEEQLHLIKEFERLINLLIIEKEKRHKYNGVVTKYENGLRDTIEKVRRELSTFNLS